MNSRQKERFGYLLAAFAAAVVVGLFGFPAGIAPAVVGVISLAAFIFS